MGDLLSLPPGAGNVDLRQSMGDLLSLPPGTGDAHLSESLWVIYSLYHQEQVMVI